MTQKTAATRYARALLDVAVKEQADLQGIRVGAHRVHRAPGSQSDARQARSESGRARAAQARRGQRVDDARAELVDCGQAARAAGRARSARAAADLLASYRDRLLDHQHVVRARGDHDHAARAADTAKAIERSLAQADRPDRDARDHVDPAIIGGVVARIGSTVYDASVTRQLEKMKQRLVESV